MTTSIIKRPTTIIDKKFDLFFLFGTAGVGLLVLFLLDLKAISFPFTLLLYGLLIAQPHFAATYLRTCPNWTMLKKNRVINIVLLIVVFALLYGLYKAFGIWTYLSAYLYFQWFHFTRQSYGISRFYAGQEQITASEMKITSYLIYGFPLAGILNWSIRSPETYLSLPVRTFIIPEYFDLTFLIFSLVIFAIWVAHRITRWKKEGTEIITPYSCYITIHCLMFYFCYYATSIMENGWLAIGIWHCLQYNMFVWLFSHKRQKNIDTKSLVKTISQKGGFFLFYFIILIVSIVIFKFLPDTINHFWSETDKFLALIIGASFVFHHYAVDAIIWRRNRLPFVAEGT